MRRSLCCLLATLLAGLVGCGGGERRPDSAPPPPPELRPLTLPDTQIPGARLHGRFTDEQGRTVAEVTELVRGGTADSEFMLLLGRGTGSVPCFAVMATKARGGTLDCFEPWERPPLVVRVVATRRGLGVVGLVGDLVKRVSIEPQSGPAADADLVGPANYPWRAFAAVYPQTDLANELVAYGADESSIWRIDFGWSYTPGCALTRDCGAQPTRRRSIEVRDPIALASGNSDGDRPLRIAFADPAVLRLAADRRYAIKPTAAWQACNGESIGAVVALRFHPAADFDGELPVHAYAEGDDSRAYRTGRTYVRAEGITAVEIWVDRLARRVVGIDLQAFDDGDLDNDMPTTDVKESRVIEEPAPAGADDDQSKCSDHEIGD